MIFVGVLCVGFWAKYVSPSSYFANISLSSEIYLILPAWEEKPSYSTDSSEMGISYIFIFICSVSLRELCEDEDDNVVLAFEQLSKTFSEKFNKVWKQSFQTT